MNNYHADTVRLIEMDVEDSAAIAARTLGYETLKRSPKARLFALPLGVVLNVAPCFSHLTNYTFFPL